MRGVARADLGSPGAPGGCHASTAGGAPSSAAAATTGPCGSATSAPTSPSATGSSVRRRRAGRARARPPVGVRPAGVVRGARAEADTLAANIDVVFLTHSFGAPPNQRRLERELVLAFDSGAEPVVVLTKADLVDDPEPARRELLEVALGVPVVLASGRTGDGIERAAAFAERQPDAGLPRRQRRRQVDARQRPARRRRAGHDRGAQATTAAATRPSPPSCCRLPGGGLADRHAGRAGRQPVAVGRRHRAGLRRRVRADGPLPVPRLQARPGAGLRGAGGDRGGTLDPDRFASLERLVAEEAALEEEQRAKEKAADGGRGRRPRPDAPTSLS